ncbi:hypothetical protein DTW90_18470 [Neorhizobium sp. P12A]|uniref:hypothetical protein n=1 Tax=Neorhizobium sp. P12A TaxID=2268027 RepID=UPI0011EF5FA0|nr:hypothetical protein [Neorhizobium sp. P12A]KAA0697416.1 hypothetical protein DTW90_18470 [Neorhizobium sp. P12A]
MVANLKSLYIPIDPLPKVDTSWLGGLQNALGDAIDKAAQNKSFEQNVVPAILGQPAPAQQPNFLQRLFGQGSAQTSIPAPAAQQQVAATNPAPAKAPVPGFGVSASPDATSLNGYLSDPSRRSTLPAGMRNNNPGNIKFVGQDIPGLVGPSQNTDQGDPQAVFATPEAGMAAMHSLLLKKYNGGKVTADQIIAGNGGWTPGNHEAAANVARYAGLAPNQDINFNDPTQAAKFMRGLMMQEHGNSSRLYPDSMITAAIGGQPQSPSQPASAQATGYAPLPQPTAAEQAIQRQMPQQVASLDPSVAASQLGDNTPYAPKTDAQRAADQARLAPVVGQLGDNTPRADALPGQVAPQIPSQPAVQQPAPTQVAASQPTAPAGPSVIAAAQPASRLNISNEQIAAMVRDPNTRQIGIQLWQQVLTGKTAQPWSFVKLDDGTLARANQSTGEVQSLGQFQSAKKNLLSNGKGGFYDADSGQWIEPPPGIAGNQDNYFGNVIKGYDSQGNPIYLQPGKDGTVNQLKTPDGFHAENRLEKVDLGTSWLIKDTTTGETQLVPKDVKGEAQAKAVGTETGKNTVDATTTLPQVQDAGNQMLATIDSLSSDPYLPNMLGPVNSRKMNLSSESERVQSKMDQINGQAFLQAYNTLRGGGQITEVEGAKATAAMGRLNTAQSVQDYQQALKELRDIVVQGINRARQKAGQQPFEQAPSAPSGNQTSTGVQWSIEK